MDKPISIIIDETKNTIVQACNSSGLSPCILEIILQNVYSEAHMLAEKQLENDLLTYSNSLAQTENKETIKDLDNA